MKTRRSIWLAMFLLVGVLLVFGASRSGGPLTQQDRIDAITLNLACPTCSGESIYVSRAPASESIRSEVARCGVDLFGILVVHCVFKVADKQADFANS